jgi:hypothetical protein
VLSESSLRRAVFINAPLAEYLVATCFTKSVDQAHAASLLKKFSRITPISLQTRAHGRKGWLTVLLRALTIMHPHLDWQPSVTTAFARLVWILQIVSGNMRISILSRWAKKQKCIPDTSLICRNVFRIYIPNLAMHSNLRLGKSSRERSSACMLWVKSSFSIQR